MVCLTYGEKLQDGLCSTSHDAVHGAMIIGEETWKVYHAKALLLVHEHMRNTKSLPRRSRFAVPILAVRKYGLPSPL